MSGPKTSHYTLTLEQRRILEEQRKIRLEREILTKQLGDARSIIAETERLIEQMEPLFVEIGADTLTLSQVKMLHKAAVTSLSQASSASDKGGAGQMPPQSKHSDLKWQALLMAVLTLHLIRLANIISAIRLQRVSRLS